MYRIKNNVTDCNLNTLYTISNSDISLVIIQRNYFYKPLHIYKVVILKLAQLIIKEKMFETIRRVLYCRILFF